MGGLKSALNLWFEEDGTKYQDDPFHLTFVPLSKSPTYRENKAQRLYAQFLENDLILYNSDTGESIWKGPDRTSYQGRPCPYLRIIFCSICSLGIPANYHPVTSGKENDITPKNLFLQPYEGVKKMEHNPSLFPFVSTARSRMFGSLSPSQLWERMDNVSSTNPVDRWGDVIKLSRFIQDIKGDKFEESAIQIMDEDTVRNPIIKHRVVINKGNSEQHSCYILSKITGDTVNTLTHPLRIKTSDGTRTVRLHHYMWRQVFGQLPSDLKAELSSCPNSWCINPFHYLLRTK